MKLPAIIDDVEALAREAAEVAMEIYHENFDVEYKKDDQNSPLTEADMESHRIIVNGLKEITPDIPVISEESQENMDFDTRKEFERFWLVDPLDGTREFVNKNGEFTVNIGLVEHGAPIAGVVVAPVLEEVYRADGVDAVVKREGESEDLRVSNVDDVEDATLVHSRSHRSDELEGVLENLDFASTEPKGSSLKICMVAEGKADVYCRFGPTWEWDTAAADAILRMAGGNITEPDENPQIYNSESLKNDRGFLITNSLLHEEVSEAMADEIGEPEGVVREHS
jgi:3'(2'), 5'-bisphosphate nucleotidase